MEQIEHTTTATATKPSIGIRFARNELAGAFGDIGIDLPLILGILVGLIAYGLPHGYAIATVIGTMLAHLVRRYPIGLTK